MNARFLFSARPGLATESVLKGLAQAHMITVTTCAIVITDDDQVAALLDKLETSERIETAAEQALAAAKDIDVRHPIDDKPKGRKPRKPYSGPLVECSKCHEKKAPFHITKTGVCKVCHMRELRAAKLQQSKKSPGQWTSAMPQSDGHHQDRLADLQARPKERIDITKLAGKEIA
jgi:hypothetical protein